MSKKDEQIDNLITQYTNLQLSYVDYNQYMKARIENLLIENDIHYQSITNRIKNIDSLKNKLKRYNVKSLENDIRNLNDLSGIRIIIYNRDETQKIINLLSNNFEILDYKEPRDGYDATNITVLTKDNRIKKFDNMKCEIQIVVILSHALIEFGHDIFYKDTEELEKKDKEGYERLKKLYNESFVKVIQLETTMRTIQDQVNDIKEGYVALNIFKDKEYINVIKNANDCTKINKILDNLNTIIEPLSKSEEVMTFIIDNHIILYLVQTFVNISDPIYDEKELFYLGTFYYTYDKLIDTIRKYIYLWKDDFKDIIEILCDYIDIQKNEKLYNKLKDMVIEVLKQDKRDNLFYTYSNIYEWIIHEPEKYTKLKMQFAEEYCNLYVEYTQEVDYMKIQFNSKEIVPNEKYTKNVEDVIKTYCELYMKTKQVEIFNEIKHMCYIYKGYKDEKNNFKLDCMMDFFNKHIENLDAYIKWELFKFGIEQEKEKFYEREIYKKIKTDKVCILYSYLYSYFLDDIPSKRHEIIEKARKEFLEKYEKTINKTKEKEIIEICILMNTYEDILFSNYFHVSQFMYNIGKNYNNAINLYEQTKNIFILIGIYNSTQYAIEIEDDVEIEKILKYLYLNNKVFSKRLFDQILSKYSIGSNNVIDNYICKIIYENEELLDQIEYKELTISIIKVYNIKKICILDNCNFLYKENKFIKIIKKSKLKKILLNISYKELGFNEEILLKEAFEIYPDLVRYYIKVHIKNYKERYTRMLNFPLNECNNFSEELENNIMFCLELLKNNSYYKLYEYVKSLIGKYDDSVFKIIKPLIIHKKYLKEIVYLLKILEVSLSGWNAIELIISVSADEDILGEIDCILFETSASGEHGLSEAFNAKYNFFDNLKSDNQKVREFISEQKNKFKALAESERLKETKRIISEKEKYELNNKKDSTADET